MEASGEESTFGSAATGTCPPAHSARPLQSTSSSLDNATCTRTALLSSSMQANKHHSKKPKSPSSHRKQQPEVPQGTTTHSSVSTLTVTPASDSGRVFVGSASTSRSIQDNDPPSSVSSVRVLYTDASLLEIVERYLREQHGSCKVTQLGAHIAGVCKSTFAKVHPKRISLESFLRQHAEVIRVPEDCQLEPIRLIGYVAEASLPAASVTAIPLKPRSKQAKQVAKGEGWFAGRKPPPKSHQQEAREKERLAQEQVRAEFESRKQSLLAGAAESGSAPSAVLHLSLLLPQHVLACGVRAEQDLQVSSDMTLSQVRQLVSDLSSHPLDAFDLRRIKPTLCAPFIGATGSQTLDQLGLVGGEVLLAQVARKGHVRSEWKAAAARETWHRPVQTTSGLATTVTARPGTSSASSVRGMGSIPVATISSAAVHGAMRDAFSFGGFGHSSSSSGSYERPLTVSGSSSSRFHPSASSSLFGFPNRWMDSSIGGAPGGGPPPVEVLLSRQRQLVIRLAGAYTDHYSHLTFLLDDIVDEKIQAEFCAAVFTRHVQAVSRTGSGAAAVATLPNVSVLLQCLCFDGFLAPTALLPGLRSVRATINTQQREFTFRTQLAAGAVSNQHDALNSLIDELQSAGPIFSLPSDQLAELIASEEEILPLPPAATSPTSIAATRKAPSSASSSRGKAAKWATYDQLSSIAAQPSYVSANRILHLGNQVPFDLFEQTAVPGGDVAVGPVPTDSDDPAVTDSLQVLIDVFSQSVVTGLMPLASLKLLHTILKNLHAAGDSDDPAKDKYRRIKLSLPKVNEHIAQVDGALRLLEATGFTRHTQNVPGAWKGEPPTEQILIFDRITPLKLVKMALTLVEPVLQKAMATAAAIAQAPPSPTMPTSMAAPATEAAAAITQEPVLQLA